MDDAGVSEEDELKLFAGGHHARFIDESTPMHLISKTFQSRFLLVPCAELNNLIAGVVGRAQIVYPAVSLHAIVFMSNHLHAIATGPANELPAFMGFIKREISRRWGGRPDVDWRGGMWSGLVATALPTPESQVNALRYVLSQGVKEDLVERPELWPGVQSVRALVDGDEMKGDWLDATRYKRALQLEARKQEPAHVDRADFFETYVIALSPLPAWAALEEIERRKLVRELVEEISAEATRRRAETGATVVGAERVMAMSRENRTQSPPPPWFEWRRRMIAWADARAAGTRDFVRRYWQFQDAFRRASRLFLSGELTVEFPLRAFRPVTWRSHVMAVATT